MALYRVNKFPLPIDVINGIPPPINPIYGKKVLGTQAFGLSPFNVIFERRFNGSVALTYYCSHSFLPSDTFSTSTLFSFGLTPKARAVEMSFNYEIKYTNEELAFDLWTELEFIFGEDVMIDFYQSRSDFIPDPEPLLRKNQLLQMFLGNRQNWYYHIIETYGYDSYTCHFFLELISGLNNKSFFDYYKPILEKAGIIVGNDITIYIAPESTGNSDGKYWLSNYYYGYYAPFNFPTMGPVPCPWNKKLIDYTSVPLYKDPKTYVFYINHFPASFFKDNGSLTSSDYYVALNGDILLLRIAYGTRDYKNPANGEMIYPTAYIVMYKNPSDFERFKQILQNLGETLDFNEIPLLYDPTLCCLAQCFGITE